MSEKNYFRGNKRLLPSSFSLLSSRIYEIIDLGKRGVEFYTTFYGFFTWSYFFDKWSKKVSLESQKKLQFEKFKKLISHAFENVPYYNEKFKSAGIHPCQIKSPEDILRIPVLTKNDVRSNFPDRIVAKKTRINPSRILSSSGSTGEAVSFIRTKSFKRNFCLGFLMRQGWRNERLAFLTTPACSGMSCSLDNSSRTLEDKVRDLLIRTGLYPHIYLPSSKNILMESDDYFHHLHQHILRYKPRFLYADPVYLSAFARYLKKNAIHVSGIKAITSSYELLQKSHKQILEETFKCEVYNQYGCSEVQDAANECEYHSMHVRMDASYPEFIRGGNPAAEGEIGRIILTDLDNYDMPFIRYEVGDMGRWSERKCPCGRNTMIIEDIEGRLADLLYTSSGGVVTPLKIDEIMSECDGFDAYQVVQNEYEDFDIFLLKNRERKVSPTYDIITTAFIKLFGKNTTVKLHGVRELLPERSMKYRSVYSKIPARSTAI